MTLTTFTADPYLDMPAHRGQRVERYTFRWVNGVTNETLGFIRPSRGDVPTLSHDVQQTIKRRLTLTLNAFDTAQIDPLTDRILPAMVIGGTTYPLGRYMFTDATIRVSTGGDRGTYTLLDEGFIIDQELESGFTAAGGVVSTVLDLLEGLPIPGIEIEPTPYSAVGSWSAGQTRGQVLTALEEQGDLFPHWFDHIGTFRLVRAREPATAIPSLDLDSGGKIMRDSIERTSDVLTAPNRFVVISNSDDAEAAPIVGSYEIPASAPHSVANRGFTIVQTFDLQVASIQQASAVAKNLGIRRTVFERATLQTMNDPRHNSYDVIRLDGSNWLELAWTMQLTPGGRMDHVMRRAYV